MDKPYALRYMSGGSSQLYDIPGGSEKSMQQIDDEINLAYSKFIIPKYIVMNPNAYSSMCSYLSNEAGLDQIHAFTKYKDLDVIVVSVTGNNLQYTSIVFGAYAEPSSSDFWRTLNQAQFRK